MGTTFKRYLSVDLEITVDVPVEHAFKVFTEDFDRIKPREHNMLPVEIAETVLEPASAVAPTTAASTAAPVSGRVSSPSIRPTGW